MSSKHEEQEERRRKSGSQESHMNISLPQTLDFKDAKKAFALKIVGNLPSGGSSPAKIIHAFIQVKDYEGLDRYLNKYTVAKDVLDFALQKACIASNAEAVDVLASHGANVDFVDQFGTTLLHFAMRGGGKPQVLLALLKHGMQYQDWRCDGQSLLHWAAQWGHVNIVSDLIDHRKASIHESDNLGRLPLHVAATYGRPNVLGYLIGIYAHNLQANYVPKLFLDALDDLNNSDIDKENNPEDNDEEQFGLVPGTTSTPSLTPSALAKNAAAANYLDNNQRTPLHCASSEEAVNDYPQCIALLLESGGDPMLRTIQGKTALDLAYEAGRAKILIDIMPTEMMVELLMRINDVVPRAVRQHQAEESTGKWKTAEADYQKRSRLSPNQSLQYIAHKSSITGLVVPPSKPDARNRSMIRRLTEPKNPIFSSKVGAGSVGVANSGESMNLIVVWRKILLNDDVELLDTLRDSLYWCHNYPDYLQKKRELRGKALHSLAAVKRSPADFETSQGLTAGQRSELFFDCYENGTGVFSHILLNFSVNIKAHDFLTVLRSLTGLVVFEQLSVDGVTLLSPLHTSILFLAVICGRFRVVEHLIRMRQFDLIPASVLVVLILHRLYQEPTFPEQVRCELQQIASVVEAIAVDALTMVSLKDNTPEKEICRGMLNAPLRIGGELSLIDLFAQAKCTNLLSLPICQRVLDERWRGILIHLPNWIGRISRFCPFVGLTYLERKARKERAKALAEFIAEAASYTGTPDATVERNVFSPLSKEIEGWQTKNSSIYQKNIHSSPLHKRKHRNLIAAPSQRLTYFSKQNRFPLTIYDRLSSQYGWQNSPRLNFVKAIYISPEVKFFFHSMFHIIFLITFTAVVVNNLHYNIHYAECCSVAYVLGYGLEEVRQMIIESLRGHIGNYLSDSWNMLELTAVGFTMLGFLTRISKLNAFLIPPGAEAYDDTFYLARVLYLFGLHLFCMRTLYITSISPIIGPRLKMMADMLRKDLVPLLIVFAIFLFSYGVSFQGLMYPNSFAKMMPEGETAVYTNMSFPIVIEKLISRAFYSMFEVSVALEEAECTETKTCGNKFGNKLVILFVLIVYTGIVNLILINLLIALFSNTVSRIGMQSTAHWLADRYQMVKEYQDKSIFPPPLNILSIFIEICACCSRMCRWNRRRRKSDKNDLSQSNTLSSSHYLDELENGQAGKHDDFEVGRRVTDRKWTKKIRNSKRAAKLTHSRHVKIWGKNSEVESVLQFILVQSFALKDRRYTLGNSTNAGASNVSMVSNATIALEHKLQSLEKQLEDFLPKLLEEMKLLRNDRRFSMGTVDNTIDPPSNISDSHRNTIRDSYFTHDSGMETHIQRPGTSAMATQSSFDDSQVIPAKTVPRDLLYKRPISHL